MENTETEAVTTPEEVKAQLPNYLGPIRYGPERYIDNCLAMTFDSSGAMNRYFEMHRDQLVAAIIPGTDGAVIALVAKVVNSDEQKEMDEIMEIVHEERAKRKAARDEAQDRADEAQRLADEETKALIALGRKVKEHNIIEENRKLKEQLAEIRKLVKKLEAGKK
jgi:hypothetical protein